MLAASAVIAVPVAGTADAKRRPPVDQTQMILRLSDLPPGYVNVSLGEGYEEDRILCSRISRPGRTRLQLGRFLDRFRPRGCVSVYQRLFEVPGQPAGPIIAGTGILAMDNSLQARLAWHFAPILLAQLMENHPPKEVAVPAKIGSATRLFHTNDPPAIYPLYYLRLGRTASFLVWRTGNRLAVVMTTGDSFATTDRAAIELARRQQAHIRRPTPYTSAERFDGDVALDDPALEQPVYWLGRNFRPGRDLPDNRLFASFSFAALSFGEDSPFRFDAATPGARLGIRYRNLRLYDWTREGWPEYARTRAGRAIVAWRCTRKRRIELPTGHAVIYGGYTKNHRRCPTDPPDAFTARVYVGDLTIAVNPTEANPFGFIEIRNPYGSFKGMEAIVRGLRLRSRPSY